MTCYMIWAWQFQIFLNKKIILKKIKKNHKMTHNNYYLHSINYFNNINENDQIK